jgi:hypothetical protein
MLLLLVPFSCGKYASTFSESNKCKNITILGELLYSFRGENA